MISVVLATHNEENNLERCLRSIKHLADEIIIVDGESTDKTTEIGKQFKANVISTTNKANFHINKQMAMDEAQGDLILQLDADEVVDTKLSEFIRSIADKEQQDISAWWINRKNFFLGHFLHKGGQYPDPVIRLYRKGKAKLPQKDVHEQMIVEGEVRTATGHLLHYSNPTFSEYLRKFDTYTSFKARQLQDTKLNLTLLNTLTYLFVKPSITFVSLYLRHRGYTDGLPGFIFALFSGLHHLVAYIKLWELNQTDVN